MKLMDNLLVDMLKCINAKDSMSISDIQKEMQIYNIIVIRKRIKFMEENNLILKEKMGRKYNIKILDKGRKLLVMSEIINLQ